MSPWNEFIKEFRQELELHLEWFYRRYRKYLQHRKKRYPEYDYLDKELGWSFKDFILELQKDNWLGRMVNEFDPLPDRLTFKIGPTEYKVLGDPRTLALLHKKVGERFGYVKVYHYPKTAWPKKGG